MAKIIVKENNVLAVETRPHLFVIAQALKNKTLNAAPVMELEQLRRQDHLAFELTKQWAPSCHRLSGYR